MSCITSFMLLMQLYFFIRSLFQNRISETAPKSLQLYLKVDLYDFFNFYFHINRFF